MSVQKFDRSNRRVHCIDLGVGSQLHKRIRYFGLFGFRLAADLFTQVQFIYLVLGVRRGSLFDAYEVGFRSRDFGVAARCEIVEPRYLSRKVGSAEPVRGCMFRESSFSNESLGSAMHSHSIVHILNLPRHSTLYIELEGLMRFAYPRMSIFSHVTIILTRYFMPNAKRNNMFQPVDCRTHIFTSRLST
jgi:hypothetical protein